MNQINDINWLDWEISMWYDGGLITLSVRHLRENIRRQGSGKKYLELRAKLMEDVMREINNRKNKIQ